MIKNSATSSMDGIAHSVAQGGSSALTRATSTPTLDVVIVAWRGSGYLRKCLATLLSHLPSDATTTVHVVDNASGDTTPDMVEREFPTVRLHRMTENRGFSVANNVVLRESRADFCLVLNPDTEMRPAVLDHLLNVMHSRPDVGMVGCRLVQHDGTFDHAAKRSFPTPAAALAHFTGVGRRLSQGALTQYRATSVGEFELGETDAVNGAFMLVRREALIDVGLLDEGYWLYMEDLDWCARFWERGWKVLYDGTVTAIHVKGGTAGTHRAWKQNLHFHRGMGRFYRRHSAGQNALLDWAVYAGIGLKLAISGTRSAVARSAARRVTREASR